MTIGGMTLYQIALYFLIYSFLGWTLEVVYQAAEKGLIVNRGFLNGPVCPIYGVGAVGIFMLIHQIGTDTGRVEDMSLWVTFLGGVILSTLIELVGGFLLDHFFHARWWDYSKKPLNFHGYICLEFSLLWGVAIVIVVREIQPFFEDHVETIVSHHTVWIIMGVLYAMYLADFIVSVSVMNGLNREFASLDKMRSSMRLVSDGLSERLGEGALETSQKVGAAKVQSALARAEFKEEMEKNRQEARLSFELSKAEYQARKDQFYEKVRARRHFGSGRLLRAFPEMEHHVYSDFMEDLRKYLDEHSKAE